MSERSKRVEGRRPNCERDTYGFVRRCYMCQAGFPQVCEQKRAYGIGIDGAFTKYVALPARLLHRLPGKHLLRGRSSDRTHCHLHHVDSRTISASGRGICRHYWPRTDWSHLSGNCKPAGVKMVGMTGRSADEGVRFQKRENWERISSSMSKENPVEKVLELTGGRGVDILSRPQEVEGPSPRLLRW